MRLSFVAKEVSRVSRRFGSERCRNSVGVHMNRMIREKEGSIKLSYYFIFFFLSFGTLAETFKLNSLAEFGQGSIRVVEFLPPPRHLSSGLIE